MFYFKTKNLWSVKVWKSTREDEKNLWSVKVWKSAREDEKMFDMKKFENPLGKMKNVDMKKFENPLGKKKKCLICKSLKIH